MGYHNHCCDLCGEYYHESQPDSMTFQIAGIEDYKFHVCYECSPFAEQNLVRDFAPILRFAMEVDGSYKLFSSVDSLLSLIADPEYQIYVITFSDVNFEKVDELCNIAEVIAFNKLEPFTDLEKLTEYINEVFESTDPFYKPTKQFLEAVKENCNSQFNRLMSLKRKVREAIYANVCL
jgi:hypothetical protein